MHPDCTTEAVTKVLAGAGFTEARTTGPYRDPVSEGFHVLALPLAGPPRIAVSWNHLSPGPHGSAEDPDPQLMRLSGALEAAGYQAERVLEFPGDYLVVRAGGPS